MKILVEIFHRVFGRHTPLQILARYSLAVEDPPAHIFFIASTRPTLHLLIVFSLCLFQYTQTGWKAENHKRFHNNPIVIVIS